MKDMKNLVMASEIFKEIELYEKNVSNSAEDATYSKLKNDAALMDVLSLPSLNRSADSLDQRALSAAKRSIPKVRTTDETQRMSPAQKLEEGKKRSSESSTSSTAYNNDSAIEQNYRGQTNIHPKRRRRRRKELMSRDSFFVDTHQELLFRYGPGYRGFVIPFEREPEEPMKTRRERKRKES